VAKHGLNPGRTAQKAQILATQAQESHHNKHYTKETTTISCVGYIAQNIPTNSLRFVKKSKNLVFPAPNTPEFTRKPTDSPRSNSGALGVAQIFPTHSHAKTLPQKKRPLGPLLIPSAPGLGLA
jgi:hypothetical protein